MKHVEKLLKGAAVLVLLILATDAIRMLFLYHPRVLFVLIFGGASYVVGHALPQGK